MRVFVAIDLPEEIKQKVSEIQKRLPGFNGKLTEQENLHLTLKFLGEVDDEKIIFIKDKLKEIKFGSFESEITNIGFFDNRKSSKYSKNFILWIHLTNCEKLQGIVDEKLLEFFGKEKRFMAHLTIARVKEVDDEKLFLQELKEIKFSKMKFRVKNFMLKQSILASKGPLYQTIEEYTLD